MPREGQASSNEDMLVMAVVVGTIVGLPYLSWHGLHEPLARMAMALARAETAAILPALSMLGLPLFDYPGVDRFIASSPLPGDLTLSQFLILASISARPLVPGVLVFAVWARGDVLRRRVGEIYNRRIGLEELIQIQSRHFPWLLPIVRDNPLADRTGRWDKADTPSKWLARHGIPAKTGEVGLDQAGKILSAAGIDVRLSELLYGDWRSAHPTSGITPPAVADHIGKLMPAVAASREGERVSQALHLGWMVLDAARHQLGALWAGPRMLAWHERALYAMFTMRIALLRDESEDLAGRLSELWLKVRLADQPKTAPKGPHHYARRRAGERDMARQFDALIAGDEHITRLIDDVLAGRAQAVAWPGTVSTVRDKGFDLFDRIARAGGLARAAERVCNQTAYAQVALLSLYACGKSRAGVFPSSYFLWLKLCNRTLWYVLNSHGRNTPHIEGAAAIAHWRAETALQRPLTDPRVGEVMRGILDDSSMKAQRAGQPGQAVPAWARADFFERDETLSGTEIYDSTAVRHLMSVDSYNW